MEAAPIPEDDEQRLETLRKLDVLDTLPELQLDRLVALAAHLFAAPTALISLVDRDRQWFKARIGLEATETARDISFCGHVVFHGETLVVEDTHGDARFADNPLVTEEPRIRFYAGAPVRAASGHVLGTVCVLDHVARTASEQQLRFLETLALQVADTLQLRRQVRAVDESRKLLAAIAKAQTEFIGSTQPRQAAQSLLSGLLDLTLSNYGFIGEIFSTATGEPFLRTLAITNIAWDEATRRLFDQATATGMEFYNLNTLFGQVMVTEKTVISNDPASDPRRGGLPPGHPNLDAFLGMPIRAGGEMVGMLGVANRPGGYDDDVVDALAPMLLTCGTLISALQSERGRNEADRALLESEARSRGVLESTLDAVITIDESGTIEMVNPASERLFGYESTELMGKNVRMLMPEPDQSRHDSYLHRYLETGERRIIGIGRETRGLRKDGTFFPIDLAVTELANPGRRLFTGIVRDISERRRAEANLAETLRSLEANNQNMLAILNEIRIGIVMLDDSGVIRFASTSCERILERAAKHVVGEHWEAACPFTSDQKRQLRKMFDAEPGSRERLSARLTLTTGRDFWTDVEVRDDPRDPSGKILFLYDMTEVHRLRTDLNDMNFRQILGTSPAMQELFALMMKVAAGDWTVLINGETGVGKELVAHALHAQSSRSEGPFVAVNCAGLTESLLTTQLFGHRRGAFTGAVADQEGLFEAAGGGTLFLDEIGEVPLAVQAALLRALQEREITRVGDSRPRKVDIRILTATNRDLAEETRAGRFRQDLLYRIQGVTIRVPPLRERLGDLPLLVASFISEGGHAKRKPVSGISPTAMARLQTYPWPGNVRELKNVIEMAIINAETPVIEVTDLPAELRGDVVATHATPMPSAGQPLSLREALAQAGENRSRAAALLGISRATLYRRLKEAGIEPKRSPAGPPSDTEHD